MQNFIEDFTKLPYKLQEIQQDASSRKYYRLHYGEKSAIIMDCQQCPEVLESFAHTTKILTEIGVRVPKIYQMNKFAGIVEDFGDNKISSHLVAFPGNSEVIYMKSVEILAKIVQNSPDCTRHNLPNYCANEQLASFDRFFEFYLPNFTKLQAQDLDICRFSGEFSQILQGKFSKSLVLRDYHVDNILVLSGGNLGVIDYQDLSIGSPIYDLVSILDDVRSSVDLKIVQKCQEYFASELGYNFDEFYLEYNSLSLQRNVRILGCFAKLAALGRVEYLKYLPRCKELIANSMKKVPLSPEVLRILTNALD